MGIFGDLLVALVKLVRGCAVPLVEPDELPQAHQPHRPNTHYYPRPHGHAYGEYSGQAASLHHGTHYQQQQQQPFYPRPPPASSPPAISGISRPTSHPLYRPGHQQHWQKHSDYPPTLPASPPLLITRPTSPSIYRPGQRQQQPDYPPSLSASSPPHLISRPTSPPIYRPGQQQPGPQDYNQINKQNEHYMALRARAKAAGDQMARCFEQSRAAYAGGEGARAKQLSNEGKSLRREMVDLSREASEWIFAENNKDRRSGEVDLHGLGVKEAISYADTAIQNARKRGESTVYLIVGRGLHSQDGVAKVKPAVEELIHKHHLVAEIDPRNSGVLIVALDGRGPAWKSRL